MFILDPGSDFFPSRIPDPNCLHPGSRILIKEFKYFNPQKIKKMVSKLLKIWSGLFIPDPRSQIRIRNTELFTDLPNKIYFFSSVPDHWHFGTDPDSVPRTYGSCFGLGSGSCVASCSVSCSFRQSEPWIRIRNQCIWIRNTVGNKYHYNSLNSGNTQI